MMRSCPRSHVVAYRIHGHICTQATMVKLWATLAKDVRVGGMEIAAAIASMYPPNKEHPVFYHWRCVEGVSYLDMKSVIADLQVCKAPIVGEISEDIMRLSHLFQPGEKLPSHVTVVPVLRTLHTMLSCLRRFEKHCVPEVHLHTLKTRDYACSMPGTCTYKFLDVPRHIACKITCSSCGLSLQDDPSNVPVKLPAFHGGFAFKMTR